MSKVSGFGFSNTTDGTHTVTQKLLGFSSNYTITKDTATETAMDNKTAPTDCQELISFRCHDIKTVSTALNIQFPSPVKAGVNYQIEVQDTLSTTDTADPSFRVDEPIVMYLTIRHPKSGNIGNAQVATVFQRLVSALMRSDGTWRFDDLMRGGEKPTAD